MARTRAFALFVAVVLALAGCSAFFDFNAFSSLDKAAVPDPSRYQGLSGLVNLQNDLASKSVVNALKGNYALSQQILTNLMNDPSYPLTGSPPWSPAQQTAAILYSSLALQCTSGDQLANAIIGAVMTSVPTDVKSLLKSIIPADVMADQSGTSFLYMINGLVQAKAMYQKLGASIPPDPVGMNMGDVAQKAAVALLMDTVNQVVIGAVGAVNAVSEMWALVNDQPNSIESVPVSDPFSPLPAWLKNIFDAADAPYPA